MSGARDSAPSRATRRAPRSVPRHGRVSRRRPRLGLLRGLPAPSSRPAERRPIGRVNEQPDEQPDERAPLPWRGAVVIVAIIYAVAFVFLNDDRVEVNFVVARAETPLVFLIVLSMALGALIAFVLSASLHRRR
ncbi:MAG: LapA family protein [Thermoleophilia bacterium]|nr:LapA family protein [Thermoleophilia bacterium]